MTKTHTTSHYWVSNLTEIIENGLVSSPRGLETREILAHRAVIDMEQPIITAPYRDLGYKFMAAEAAWILSGDNRVETIAPYSKAISKFSDNGETFFGAYGPKVLGQIDYVVRCLAENQDTRQAVINIWRENPRASKDIPCTLSAQWVIRQGHLYCFDTMRSSDIWLGHPYDIFNFSMISLYILLRLRKRGVNVELGQLALTAGSKHLYSTNYDKAKEVLKAYMTEPESFANDIFVNPEVFDNEDHLVERLWAMADSVQGALNKELWS